MNARIRLGKPGDARALKGLDSVVPDDPSRSDWIDRWLRDDTVVIAEVDGCVVGYGVFNHGFFRQGQAEMVMLRPEYRGRRIGEQLLLALEARCDTPKFFVTTNLSNHRMQNLLWRMGYEACGYIGQLDPGDPEMVFVKTVVRSPKTQSRHRAARKSRT